MTTANHVDDGPRFDAASPNSHRLAHMPRKFLGSFRQVVAGKSLRSSLQRSRRQCSSSDVNTRAKVIQLG
jgi:hypothetical protein